MKAQQVEVGNGVWECALELTATRRPRSHVLTSRRKNLNEYCLVASQQANRRERLELRVKGVSSVRTACCEAGGQSNVERDWVDWDIRDVWAESKS